MPGGIAGGAGVEGEAKGRSGDIPAKRLFPPTFLRRRFTLEAFAKDALGVENDGFEADKEVFDAGKDALDSSIIEGLLAENEILSPDSDSLEESLRRGYDGGGGKFKGGEVSKSIKSGKSSSSSCTLKKRET